MPTVVGTGTLLRESVVMMSQTSTHPPLWAQNKVHHSQAVFRETMACHLSHCINFSQIVVCSCSERSFVASVFSLIHFSVHKSHCIRDELSKVDPCHTLLSSCTCSHSIAVVDDSKPPRYLAADERVVQAKAEASSSAQFVLCVHSTEKSVLEVVGSVKHNVSREGGYWIRMCPPARRKPLAKHSWNKCLARFFVVVYRHGCVCARVWIMFNGWKESRFVSVCFFWQAAGDIWQAEEQIGLTQGQIWKIFHRIKKIAIKFRQTLLPKECKRFDS